MTSMRAILAIVLAIVAMAVLDTGAAAQTSPPWSVAVETAAPGMPAARAAARPQPTGMCTILRADKVSEQQSCSAVRDSIASIDTSSGQRSDRGTTYLWPSGNRTLVGGTDEDFSVNGNLAVPNPSDELGLCLKVEKTGNTFCYKEGAKPKVAISAQPAVSQAVLAADPRSCDQLWNDRNSIFKASGLCFQAERAVKHFGNEGCRTPDIGAVTLSAAQAAQVSKIKSVEAAKNCAVASPQGVTAESKQALPAGAKPEVPAVIAEAKPVLGEAKKTPEQAAAKPASATDLDEQVRLRKTAEEKISALEAEVARLKDAELKRAITANSADEEAKRREDSAREAKQIEEARAASILKEIDTLQTRCAARNAGACESALALMNEAVVTGSVNTARRSELARLHRLAQAPFGMPILGAFSGVPMSTWVASMVAALLALTHLMRRRHGDHLDPIAQATRSTPTLDNTAAGVRPPPLPPIATVQTNFKADAALQSIAGIDGRVIIVEPMDEPASYPTGQGASRTAYLLNVLLPGTGNVYFGQRGIGANLIVAMLMAIALLFVGAKGVAMGLALVAISLVIAFPTAGLSLLVGVPIGLILLLMGAGPVVSLAIWLFGLVAAQMLVYARAGLSNT